MPEGIAPAFRSPATMISLSSLRGEAKASGHELNAGGR
jgi:hypothetical protein